MDKEIVKKNLQINPFAYTGNVLIETTNVCNYALLHKKCPASLIKEPKSLPLEIIEQILKLLGKHDFQGIIYPFLYSEPLADPRFFYILTLIEKYVPKAKIWLYSNGFNVDDSLIKEMDKFRVNRLNFSVYSPEEGRRIHKMILRVRDNVSMVLRAYQRYPMDKKMNNKMCWLDDKAINIKRPCPSPLKFLTINAFGEVIICCHDWKRIHVFGSLYKQELNTILQSDNVIETFLDLLKGERYKYTLCAHCLKHR